VTRRLIRQSFRLAFSAELCDRVSIIEEENNVTAELVACPKCARNNNPLRQNCIYCGAPLPVVEEITPQMIAARASKTQEAASKNDLDPLSQISSHLQQNLLGYNVVMMPINDRYEGAVEALTAITSFTDIEARQLLEFTFPMPLVRLQYEIEAKAAVVQLQSAGLRMIVVSDEKLQPATPNRRAKRLSIDGNNISVNFETSNEPAHTVSSSDIRLIVEGKIRYRQMQSTEQNKGFGKFERELTDAVEFVDEQPVIDIYTSSLDTSFRVRAEAFDYSCLGSNMRLTTIENYRRLLSLLRDSAQSAKYDADFKQCMKLLEMVWPSMSRNESLGLRRAQLLTAGKITTRSARHIDNEMQFNRYSRLRYHFMISGL
jgi:hypothetical protein